MNGLLDEVKGHTRELFGLLDAARDLGLDAAGEIASMARDVEHRLTRAQREIYLAGDFANRRAILDVVAGARAFSIPERPSSTLLLVRHGPALDYAACLRSGTIERFHERSPDRDETFARAIARGERDVEAEANTIAVLGARIATAKASRAEAATKLGLFARLWAFILALFTRRQLPPAPKTSEPDEPTRMKETPLAELERSLRDAESRAEKAREHLETLKRDRARYAEERRASFFADVRSLADPAARGKDAIELAIEVPSDALPPGVTLVDAPDVPADVDGCLLVGDAATRTRLLDHLRPRRVAPNASPQELRRALEQIEREAPIVMAERAVALARRSIGAATEAAAKVEAVCHERIAALEGQRLTDPAEFRKRSLARMTKAIDDGADEVTRAAVARLAPRMAQIKAEWKGAVSACSDRKSIEACVRTIQETAPARLGQVVEETSEFVLGELQRVSDSLQIWVLEEIHAKYEVARRASMSDAGAPVISEVSAEAMPALDTAALTGAMNTFESQRVGLGLGGAAAGAVLGTLIAPVIGTAIGAFLGVFAGFLKGVDSLKEDCVQKLEACVDDGEKQLRAQLEAKRDGFAAALKGSLEDALDGAMARFERSITRLMELEKKTLAAENDKLARLATLRAALETHEAKITELASRL